MDPETKPSQEPVSVDELVESAVEGLWIRLRDVILAEERLERFVF